MMYKQLFTYLKVSPQFLSRFLQNSSTPVCSKSQLLDRAIGVLGNLDHTEVCQWQWIRRDAWPLLPEVPRAHWAQKVQEMGWLRESAQIFELSLACVKAAWGLF